jgi:hypothetical protein
MTLFANFEAPNPRKGKKLKTFVAYEGKKMESMMMSRMMETRLTARQTMICSTPSCTEHPTCQPSFSRVKGRG